jgi:hypothetical protein
MNCTFTRLTSSDLKRMLAIRLQIEAYDRQLLAIYARAKSRPRPTAFSLQSSASPGRQPSLRELITGILRQAKKPMSVHAIYEATLLAGYHWRSQEPINALNVKMYTDPTFKKASPGRFVLRSARRPPSATPR